jgi:hypothetical protein
MINLRLAGRKTRFLSLNVGIETDVPHISPAISRYLIAGPCS